MSKLYLTKCPKCGGYLKEDDINELYRKNQVEWSHCPYCQKDYKVVVRYGKIYRLVEIN